MVKSTTADPRDNTNVRTISHLTRQRIDMFMESMVADTNDKIYLKFRELGVTYVPFKLVYHSRNTRYAVSKWHNVKNVTLEIDKKFTDAYFSKKIGFYSWLSTNYPDVKKDVVQGKEPDLKRYIRKFNKEYDWEEQKPFSKDDWNGSKQKQGVVAGYIKERAGSGGFHEWEPFTGKQLSEYLENEDYIFKGKALKGEKKSVMSEYMERQSDDTNKKIHEVLNEVLKKFNEAFMETPLTHVIEDENVQKMQKKFDKPAGKRNQKKLDERPEDWKKTYKFPNIENIRRWFIKTGIYKSYKFDEFAAMKSTKQKKNFIDQSVFLIANGVFAKRRGEQSYKLTRDPETPNMSFRKYRETAGAKIRASTMRRRAGVDLRAQRRKNKYDNWNKEVERMARGWKNRDRRRKTR